MESFLCLYFNHSAASRHPQSYSNLTLEIIVRKFGMVDINAAN